MLMTCINKSNVILLTRGTKGDLYPFLNIGLGFKERGCRVTLLSNYCYADYAFKEGFDFIALDDEESYQVFNNMPEYYKNLPSLLDLYRKHTVTTLEKELSILESIQTPGNTIIIANSNHYLASIIAKEKFKVPLHLCLLAPSYIHSFALFEGFLKNLSSEINGVRVKIGLGPISDWGRWLKNFDSCFAFWPEWFSTDTNNILNDISYAGFLPIDELEDEPLQNEIIEFLDKRKKNILITHGTSKPFNDAYFQLGIDVSCKLGYSLIVSTPFRELLPEVLPDHVIWVDFCPFHKLLPSIDLIIHHGGIGTARESIANMVPQLIIGQGFDRQHNGKIIKSLELGDWIVPKLLDSATLSEKIKSIFLNYDKYKTNCESFSSFIYKQNEIEYFYDYILTNLDVSDKSCLSEEQGQVHNIGLEENTPISTKRTISDNSLSINKKNIFQKLLKAGTGNK